MEPICLPVSVDQLPLGKLRAHLIENRNLLPTGMIIALYNFHEGFSLIQQSLVLNQKLLDR